VVTEDADQHETVLIGCFWDDLLVAIEVKILGNKGATADVFGTATSRALTTLSTGLLVINGTSGNDVMSLTNVAGNMTRVLTSDLSTLSAFLQSKFSYDTGPFEDIPDQTPAKRFLLRSDYNINNTNKITFRYNHLNSFTDVYTSSGVGVPRLTARMAMLVPGSA
jgi:hypothetical protein